MSDRPVLILYSGLGVDERLIGPQRAIDADVVVPRWIDPLPDESLADYAKRMAAALDPAVLNPAVPVYVGGVSFGGMIAQEVARHVPTRGLVLIATCRSNLGLPLPYRWACTLGSYMPLWMMNLAKPIIPRVRVLMGISKNREVEWFSDMIADTEAAFLRWCLGAIAKWPGVGPTAPTSLPTVHVHGEADLVIPPAWNRPTHLIPYAGHVCNVTHPAEVNAVITEFLHAQARDPVRDPAPHPPSPAAENRPASAGTPAGP